MTSRPLTRAALVAALVIALDRASKIWVLGPLDLPARGMIEVADPWLNLVMVWNEGINFGLFDFGAAGRFVLIGLALAIVATLAFWVRRATGIAAAIGVGMVIGGALGNVWDRVQFGAVADFLNMSCCGIANPYAFNIADAAIFAGVAVLILFARTPADDGRDPARRRDGRGGLR